MFRGHNGSTENFANVVTETLPNYKSGGTHNGIDIIANPGPVRGMPVYSVGSGTVDSAGLNGGYGTSVIILTTEHTILYAHFLANSLGVSRGITINSNRRLGNVGNTGDVKGIHTDGSHLHFEVRKLDVTPDNPRGTPVNPIGNFYPLNIFEIW
jgi:murein DD-endopeptidase MepM/ murein hydrolase activator NlpD